MVIIAAVVSNTGFCNKSRLVQSRTLAKVFLFGYSCTFLDNFKHIIVLKIMYSPLILKNIEESNVS